MHAVLVASKILQHKSDSYQFCNWKSGKKASSVVFSIYLKLAIVSAILALNKCKIVNSSWEIKQFLFFYFLALGLFSHLNTKGIAKFIKLI